MNKKGKFMEKCKLLKLGIVILVLMTAGIFYSCRGNRDTGTVLSFENSTEEEPVSDATSGSGNHENSIAVQETGNKSVSVAEKPVLTASSGDSALDTGDSPGDTATAENNQYNYIYIYICGAVEKPDVYKVEADTRLVNVIELAGGLTKDAAGDYVNQAALVQDGQKVYIPTKEEVEGTVPESYPGNNQDTATGNTLKEVNSSGKVNINKASAEELMTLPGIGEAKAAGIIAYRQEQGGFKSIEEIMNINGIKNSVFNKISDKITVD